MDNKEFIVVVAGKVEVSAEVVKKIVETMSLVIQERIREMDSVHVNGLGVFETFVHLKGKVFLSFEAANEVKNVLDSMIIKNKNLEDLGPSILGTDYIKSNNWEIRGPDTKPHIEPKLNPDLDSLDDTGPWDNL